MREERCQECDTSVSPIPQQRRTTACRVLTLQCRHRSATVSHEIVVLGAAVKVGANRQPSVQLRHSSPKSSISSQKKHTPESLSKSVFCAQQFNNPRQSAVDSSRLARDGGGCARLGIPISFSLRRSSPFFWLPSPWPPRRRSGNSRSSPAESGLCGLISSTAHGGSGTPATSSAAVPPY